MALRNKLCVENEDVESGHQVSSSHNRETEIAMEQAALAMSSLA